MQETKILDRRIFERIPVKLPLRFLNLTPNKQGLAQTHDISGEGIGIEVDEKLLPHTYLEMQLQIPHSDVPIYTKGRVVWSENVQSNHYRVGISLEEVKLMKMWSIIRNKRLNKI